MSAVSLYRKAGQWTARLNNLLALLTAFFLTWPDAWINKVLFAWLLVWSLDLLMHLPAILPKIKERLAKMAPSLWLMAVFYLILLISCLYSSNVEYVGTQLERRLCFLLIPLLGLCGFPESDISVRNALKAFVAGAFVSLLLSMLLPLLAYLFYPQTHNLLRMRPSVLGDYVVRMYKHRGYLGMLVLMALITFYYLREDYIARWRSAGRFYTCLLAASVLLFVWMLVCGCRIVPLTMGALVVIEASRRGWNRHKVLVCTLLAAVLLLFGLIFAFHPRFQSLHPSALRADTELQLKEGRVGIWSASLAVLREHWLWGAGTGDFKDELMLQYEALHLDDNVLLNRSHTHNNFLNVWLEAGLPALLCLLLMLVCPLLECRNSHRRRWAAALMFCFVMLMLVDSVFMQRGGLFAFCLFMLALSLPEGAVVAGDGAETETAAHAGKAAAGKRAAWLETRWLRADGPERGNVVRGDLPERAMPVQELETRLLRATVLLMVPTLLLLLILPSLARPYDPTRPSTYATTSFQSLSELPGAVPEALESCEALKISAGVEGNYAPSRDIVDWSSPFYLPSSECRRFSAWCYVSEDFNAEDVMLRTASPVDRYLIMSHYNMEKRGTWQLLSLDFEEMDPAIPFVFYFRRSGWKDFDALKGYVLFALPRFE